MPQTITSRYLTQLVSVVKEQHQTGLLRVEQVGKGANERGEIYFENGRIFNARIGDERGMPALKRISTWEHAIYTFQHVNKSPTAHPLEETGASEYLVSALDLLLGVATPSQSLEAVGTLAVKKGQRRQGTSVIETPRPAFGPQPRNQASFAHLKPVLATAPASQMFVLHGEALEEYTPASPPRMSPSSRRWTTHHQDEPQQALEEIHSTPAPEDGALPGRQAIYQTRVTITSTGSMQKMERRARLVFVLLDGKRTVQHIAKLLHLAESEVGQILLKLTRLGFVEYIGG